MYTLSDKFQFQAHAIKQGEHKLAAVHQELMDWITKEFNVRALDFFCETRETSKGAPQQLIHMILETLEDVKQIYENHADNTMITERFLKYLKSADSNNYAADPLKSNVFPFETNPFPEIIVAYRPLKELDKKIREGMLQKMSDDEIRAILKTFESVWNISMAVVFYFTDAQVKENLANGTSAKINETLKQAERKYGFSGGSDYRFDSKESFDRDSKGDWYLYWK